MYILYLMIAILLHAVLYICNAHFYSFLIPIIKYLVSYLIFDCLFKKQFSLDVRVCL